MEPSRRSLRASLFSGEPGRLTLREYVLIVSTDRLEHSSIVSGKEDVQTVSVSTTSGGSGIGGPCCESCGERQTGDENSMLFLGDPRLVSICDKVRTTDALLVESKLPFPAEMSSVRLLTELDVFLLLDVTTVVLFLVGDGSSSRLSVDRVC